MIRGYTFILSTICKLCEFFSKCLKVFRFSGRLMSQIFQTIAILGAFGWCKRQCNILKELVRTAIVMTLRILQQASCEAASTAEASKCFANQSGVQSRVENTTACSVFECLRHGNTTCKPASHTCNSASPI